MGKTKLCKTWKIPDYAQPYLSVMTDGGDEIDIIGEQGEFSVSDTATHIIIRWGNSPLVQLSWQRDTLDWTGSVRVGGFVTAIHMTQLPAIDLSLAIITMEAYPLKQSVKPFLSSAERDQLPYAPSDFLDGIHDESDEGVTTWLAEIDSPLMAVMQDAMNQGHRVYAFGQLAGEEQGWHKFFALPILLESVTLFMQ